MNGMKLTEQWRGNWGAYRCRMGRLAGIGNAGAGWSRRSGKNAHDRRAEE